MFCSNPLRMLAELPGWVLRRVSGRRSVTILRHREALGDTVEVTALVRGLRKALPELRICVATRRPEVFFHNPNVDEVYGWHLFRAGLAASAAYAHDDLARDEHVLDVCWRNLWDELSAQGLKPGGAVPQLDDRHPEMFFSAEEKEAAKRELALLIPSGKPVVMLAAGGKLMPTHNREWGKENFQYVIDALAGHAAFVQVEGKDALTLNGAPIPQRINLPVRAAAALFAAADCVVAQEGGLMHLATAAGVPVAAIFGGSVLPHQTGYERNRNFWDRPDCSPCLARRKLCWHLKCMLKQNPRAVARAVAGVLKERRGIEVPEKDLERAPDFWTPPWWVHREELEEALADDAERRAIRYCERNGTPSTAAQP